MLIMCSLAAVLKLHRAQKKKKKERKSIWRASAACWETKRSGFYHSEGEKVQFTSKGGFVCFSVVFF